MKYGSLMVCVLLTLMDFFEVGFRWLFDLSFLEIGVSFHVL